MFAPAYARLLGLFCFSGEDRFIAFADVVSGVGVEEDRIQKPARSGGRDQQFHRLFLTGVNFNSTRISRVEVFGIELCGDNPGNGEGGIAVILYNDFHLVLAVGCQVPYFSLARIHADDPHRDRVHVAYQTYDRLIFAFGARKDADMLVEFAGIFVGPVVDYEFGTFPRLENDGVRILLLIGIALPERNAGAGSTGCSV